MTSNPDENTNCLEDLLPWFVNQTLEPSQQQEVENHLRHCRKCRKEVELLESVREEIKSTPVRPPGKSGLQRLRQSVRQDKTIKPYRQLNRKINWRPALAIAASMVIVVQAGLLIYSWFGPASMRPLSGPSTKGTVLQITFSPAATEAQIRDTLQSVGGMFVGGPGALGVYRIRIDAQTTDRDAIQKALANLRQKSRIVTHAAQE